MCSGSGTPGKRTSSSGNSGNSGTKPFYSPACLTCPTGGDRSEHMKLNGKVVVITGASMGIGESLARIFVEQGANVVMASRDVSRVEEARARLGPKAHDRTMAA